MKKALISIGCAVLLTFGFAAMTRAALIIRGTDTAGNRLVYDTELDVTWYDYTRGIGPITWGAYLWPASTNWAAYPGATNPDMWQDSANWAADLVVSVEGTVYDDWRLPTTWAGSNTGGWGTDGTTQIGYNITASELGHLY